MVTKAKFKVGDIIIFRFAGSEIVAEVVDVRKSTTEVSYKTLSDDGTIYPVNQNNVIRKI